MWYVTIDAVSAKEIDKICRVTKRDVWSDCGFEYRKDAIAFAEWCQEIAPLAQVEVAA